jgi:hypothetical protein
MTGKLIEIEVDELAEIKDSKDIKDVLLAIVENGYIDHEFKAQNLMIVTTENGILGVEARNPCFMVGLMTNLVAYRNGLPNMADGL